MVELGLDADLHLVKAVADIAFLTVVVLVAPKI